MDRTLTRVCEGPRNGPRSRSGCWTCRTKKVKCDEERPHCRRCTRLKLLCDYSPRTKRAFAKFVNQLEPKDAIKLGQVQRRMGMSLQLPALANSACSLDLSSADHESIRYFRTTFAKIHHTKNPDYSLYAIMFNIAERNPMVMRVILALGGQEVEFRRRTSTTRSALAALPQAQTVPPLQHYSAALRVMADTLGQAYTEEMSDIDLDVIFAALFLMLLYEKKYGDARCTGVSKHLAGASQLVRHRFREQPPRISIRATHDSPDSKVVFVRKCPSQEQKAQVLSLFSARILVHLAIQDSCAATFGMGGQLLQALNEITHDHDSNLPYVDGAESLNRFSDALYRIMWADNYPQVELLDDIENRSVFTLLTSTAQLRFMVAQLRALDTGSAPSRAAEIDSAFQFVSFRFTEIVAVADGLSMATDNSNRLVANIRDIVPHLYAVQIELDRVKRDFGIPSRLSLNRCITAIMNLAAQSFKHQGNEAMVPIAWPLYIVALETQCATQFDWIISRFHAMSTYGKNYERTYQFLAQMSKSEPGSVSMQDPEIWNDPGLFVL